MSDRSSESSGEWIILNENEEEFVLNNNEPSLNSELIYEGICDAVSVSIGSSFSSEELEWQYEQYENYMPSRRSSFIEEVASRYFDNTDDYESEDSNVEDEIMNKYVSTSDIEDEDNADVTSTSRIQSYKHYRNDRLNFILNFTLALVLASTIGLGLGHFLGWSHKCFKNTSITQKAADSISELPLPHAKVVIKEQKNEGQEHSKKNTNLPIISEKLSNSVPCPNFNGEDSSSQHNIWGASMNSNIAIDSGLVESPIRITSDVLELKTEEETSQNNFSNPYMLSIAPESGVLAKIDWNELSKLEAAAKKIHGLKEISSDDIHIDSVIEDEVNDIELEFFLKNIVKKEVPEENDIVSNTEIPFSVNENDNLFLKNKLNNDEFRFLKEYFNEEKISSRENILINQLQKDLSEVVQSLAAITFARLSDIDEKYPISVEESESVIKLFSDFQTLINTRIRDIDNFVKSVKYKDASRISLKYLQKMVYTLVDAVDYLMKISFKTLSKDGRKINVHKFSNNISKVIFNFNKKWDKNNRSWSESLEKSKVKNFRDGYLKKGKENKYWKNKSQFEKHSKKNYKYRNSMKS